MAPPSSPATATSRVRSSRDTASRPTPHLPSPTATLSPPLTLSAAALLAPSICPALALAPALSSGSPLPSSSSLLSGSSSRRGTSTLPASSAVNCLGRSAMKSNSTDSTALLRALFASLLPLPRRHRQDQASRQDPAHECAGGRGGRYHAADW